MKHGQPSRLRRVTKWAGLSISLVFCCLWYATLSNGLGYQGPSLRIMAKCGYVSVYRGSNRLPQTWTHTQLVPTFTRKMFWPHLSIAGTSFSLTVPLLWPFLLTAIPTVIIFYRDSRPPRGHCQHCGYNLTGNTTGQCPECGKHM